MVSGSVIVIMIIMIINFLFKVGLPNRWRLINANLGGVAEWLRRSVSNHASGLLAWVRIPSLDPLATSQQSTQLLILPRSVNEYSEVTLRAQALDTR